jgi:antitoxin component YwqK of YwqJK toxin-antitoxin module
LIGIWWSDPNQACVIEMSKLIEKNGYVCDYDRPVAVKFYVREDGKREGVYKTWHISDAKEKLGLFQEFHYKDGELDGRFISYHANGNIMEEGYYKMGKLHGVMREYDGSGKLIAQCYYVDDLMHGKLTKWRDVDKGTLEFTTYFAKGLPQYTTRFDENSVIAGSIQHDEFGAVIEEVNYKRSGGQAQQTHIYMSTRRPGYYVEEIIC